MSQLSGAGTRSRYFFDDAQLDRPADLMGENAHRLSCDLERTRRIAGLDRDPHPARDH